MGRRANARAPTSIPTRLTVTSPPAASELVRRSTGDDGVVDREGTSHVRDGNPRTGVSAGTERRALVLM